MCFYHNYSIIKYCHVPMSYDVSSKDTMPVTPDLMFVTFVSVVYYLLLLYYVL